MAKSQPTTEYPIKNNTLQFSNKFNEPIDKYHNIINSCGCTCSIFKIDVFMTEFNKPLTVPINVTCVHFGHSFNNSIELTRKLKFLHFGNAFNSSINLPKYLEHLTIDFSYNNLTVLNKYINELNTYNGDFTYFPKLPKKLIKFSIESEISKCMYADLKFSKNIYNVWMSINTWHCSLVLPKNIKRLLMTRNFTQTLILTPNIKILSFEWCHFEKPIYYEKLFDLLHLNFELECIFCYDNLPNGLKRTLMTLEHVNNLPNDIKTIYCCHKAIKHGMIIKKLNEEDVFLIKKQFESFDNYRDVKI